MHIIIFIIPFSLFANRRSQIPV
ncbi:hypothetical protein KM92DES2_10338 [uncultured Desulfovibrio sp.]|uniref:Uncharacterized protein n=1 Tax=uncultured Desulfovibrio sp. TaxID=167968 RepID=A0A212J0S6_9BACT|nr:hypothetical protein KM92DES2_10338 [uncultured Desulfovibrio sp.]